MFEVALPNGRTYCIKLKGAPRDLIGYRVLTKDGRTALIVGNCKYPNLEALEIPDSERVITPYQIKALKSFAKDYCEPYPRLLFRILPELFNWKRRKVLILKDERALFGKLREVYEKYSREGKIFLDEVKEKGELKLLELLKKKGIFKEVELWDFSKVLKRFFIPVGSKAKGLSPKQRELLQILLEEGGLELSQVKQRGFSLKTLNSLIKRGLVIEEVKAPKDTLKLSEPPTYYGNLEGEDLLLWGDLLKSLSHLLRELEECLKRGSVLFFVPSRRVLLNLEGLLLKRFGDRLLNLSRLEGPELYESWFKALKENYLMVGSYRVLTAPFKKLSCIAYWDTTPYLIPELYDLRDYLLYLKEETKAKLVVIATLPTLKTYRLVEEGLLRERFFKLEGRRLEVVEKVRGKLINPKVLKQLRGKVLLIVPKRGYGYAFCPLCNFLSLCPNCGNLLTYFKGDKVLCSLCHKELESFKCPRCGSSLRSVGFGLDRVMEEFPHFECDLSPRIFERFSTSLIVSVDHILSIPVFGLYSAYKLIYESLISSRRVFVQSFFKEEIDLKDVREFLREELKRRKEENLPPYSVMLLKEGGNLKRVSKCALSYVGRKEEPLKVYYD